MRGFEAHHFAGLHEVVFQVQEPQSDSNPRLEFLRVEGFGQVVVGARFESFHHAFLGVFCRQQQQ